MEPQERNNLQTLFRCAATGDKTILLDKNDNYCAIQCKNMVMTEGFEEVPILKEIQLQIYGEYPLNEAKQRDWDLKMSKLFKINQ